MMKNIIWQTSSASLVDSFEGRILSADTRGADSYEFYAVIALEKNYKLIMDKKTVRRVDEGPVKYWARLLFNRIDGDVYIKSLSAITLGKMRKTTIEIGLLHHIYLKNRRRSFMGKLSLMNYNRRLRKLDYVVTVSQYWANYLHEIGCKNIKVIYNSFRLDEFEISQEDIECFLREKDIRRDKPIIYIGYANSDKGAVEVYNALKNEDYTLLMTGPENQRLGLPVKSLCLSRRHYLCLLRACDVVVTMSKVEEGWTRIAHEAMLCKTAVVGSGSGGMEELLEGGGQTICYNIKDLPGIITMVLNKKEEFAIRGYKFVKQFDLKYFDEAWNNLINEATGPKIDKRLE